MSVYANFQIFGFVNFWLYGFPYIWKCKNLPGEYARQGRGHLRFFDDEAIEAGVAEVESFVLRIVGP